MPNFSGTGLLPDDNTGTGELPNVSGTSGSGSPPMSQYDATTPLPPSPPDTPPAPKDPAVPVVPSPNYTARIASLPPAPTPAAPHPPTQGYGQGLYGQNQNFAQSAADAANQYKQSAFNDWYIQQQAAMRPATPPPAASVAPTGTLLPAPLAGPTAGPLGTPPAPPPGTPAAGVSPPPPPPPPPVDDGSFNSNHAQSLADLNLPGGGSLGGSGVGQGQLPGQLPTPTDPGSPRGADLDAFGAKYGLARGLSQIGNGPAVPRTDAEYEGLIRDRLKTIHANTVLKQDPQYNALLARQDEITKDRQSLTPVPVADQQKQAQNNYNAALGTVEQVGQAQADAAAAKASGPQEVQRLKNEGAADRTTQTEKGKGDRLTQSLDVKEKDYLAGLQSRSDLLQKRIDANKATEQDRLELARNNAILGAASRVATGGIETDPAARDAGSKAVKDAITPTVKPNRDGSTPGKGQRLNTGLGLPDGFIQDAEDPLLFHARNGGDYRIPDINSRDFREVQSATATTQPSAQPSLNAQSALPPGMTPVPGRPGVSRHQNGGLYAKVPGGHQLIGMA